VDPAVESRPNHRRRDAPALRKFDRKSVFRKLWAGGAQPRRAGDIPPSAHGQTERRDPLRSSHPTALLTVWGGAAPTNNPSQIRTGPGRLDKKPSTHPGIFKYLKTRYNPTVHVITKKRLIEFAARYPASRDPLLKWYRIVSQTDFSSFQALRLIFGSADQVDRFTVFDIGGNKYRLIAAVHYNRRRIYIRHVLTHPEYDKGKWKEK